MLLEGLSLSILKTRSEVVGPKVSEFEVGGELLDEGLNGRLGLGDEGHVINKHRDDDSEGVSEEDRQRGQT